jgi:tetratricopeptide (TPR) repeat protein
MKIPSFITTCSTTLALALFIGLLPLQAQDTVKLSELNEALISIGKESSATRQRLMVRRLIRDAEAALAITGDKPERWHLLELLFQAQQRLTTMDKDKNHREALLATCSELIKAPDAFAACRLEADLLLSQVEQVKQLSDAAGRAKALRAFVGRYVETPASGKALKMATTLAIELGDDRLLAHLREEIAIHCAADHNMISFQRDQFRGQVFGAPFAGGFKRSDGKSVRFPMDAFGRPSMLLFWSKEGEGLEFAKGMAEAAKKGRKGYTGRLGIISINLDELPDAGESILRDLGVDWPCLHLPGGRENSVFKAYAGRDPLFLRVSSTGQTALIMEGLQRPHVKADGSIDYEQILAATLEYPWACADYCAQLISLSAGDFLVFDPEGPLNPALPPELKAVPAPKQMERGENSVPVEILQAIQDCLVAPGTCYRSSTTEMLVNYRKAADLGRKALAKHPNAPDLWVVRNRLIVALMGLWKLDAGLAHLEEASVVAKEAMESGYPNGCDIVARYCLARQALLDAHADTGGIIDQFIKQAGGDQVPGAVLACASQLALDVADRARFERCRDLILNHHTEHPMMWLYVSSLLDRHHDYWRYQVPFYVGWSYPQREAAFKERGEAECTQRLLKAELLTVDNKAFRIPEDLTADYTAIFFTLPGPWDEKGLADLPASPIRAVTGFAAASAGRPSGSVQTIMAVLADKPLSESSTDRKGKEIRHPFAMMALPGGVGNSLVHRLGLLFGQGGYNSVLVDKQGRVLCMISGISRSTMISENALMNVLTHQDALKVDALLAKGEVDTARQFIRAFTPDEDPSKYNSDHLRARAHVYRAQGDLDKALADVKELIVRQQNEATRTSQRNDRLMADEAMRDEIIRQLKDDS